MKQRTAQANQIRGLLAEFGIVIPKGISNKLSEILENNKDKLTSKSLCIFENLGEQFKTYEIQLATYDKQIEMIANHDEKCKAIMEN